MRRTILICWLAAAFLSGHSQSSQSTQNPHPARSSQPRAVQATDYFPPAGEWQHRSPASMGLDSSSLQEAIRFARENDASAPRNQELAQAESFGKEPFGEGIGTARTSSMWTRSTSWSRWSDGSRTSPWTEW